MTLVAKMVSLQARLQPQAQPSDWFWCKACNKVFPERMKLRQHNEEIHAKPSTMVQFCGTCRKAFSSKAALDVHVAENHMQSQAPINGTTATKLNVGSSGVVTQHASDVVQPKPPYQFTSSYQKTLVWLNSNEFSEVFYDIDEDLVDEYGDHDDKDMDEENDKEKEKEKEVKPKVRSRIRKKQTARKKTTKPYVAPVKAAVKKAIDERFTNVSVVLYRGDYRLCNVCGKTFLSTKSYQEHRHYMSKDELEALNKRITPVVLLDRIDKPTNSRTLHCAKCGLRLPSRLGMTSHQRLCKGQKNS